MNVPISVKGRLGASHAFWKEVLYAFPAVLEVIESGYMLLLMSKLIPIVGSNRTSAMPNAEFGNELEC